MTVQTAIRKRVLWIKADPLFPLDSGGKIRTFQMLKEWHRLHDVTYVALLPPNLSPAVRTHAALYSSHQTWIPWVDHPKGSAGFYLGLLKNLLFSKYPYVIDKYKSAAAARQINALDEENSYDIVVADFLSMILNLLPTRINPTKVIIFQHNVESQIWRRHYENAKNPLLRAYMLVQWKRYHRFEAAICAKFGGVIAVSEDDASRFRREFELTNVLGHVQTGVDVEFFSDENYLPENDHIIFLGSMDWMPNIDGIIDFVQNTYPRIKAKRPSATLTIIGRNPAANVVSLSQNDPSIIVTGTVEDVRPYMRKASAAVVPLRVGGGTRIKIFETMAMGIPVVSSTIGAEGLPVESGKNIFIADDAESFATHIISLLQNTKLARAVGGAGQKMVQEQFTWRSAVEQFDEMCNKVMLNKPLMHSQPYGLR